MENKLMDAKIEVKIFPFHVPDTVQIDGKARTFALRELDEHTLTQLCKTFTKEVFEKAGKTEPEITILPREIRKEII